MNGYFFSYKSFLELKGKKRYPIDPILQPYSIVRGPPQPLLDCPHSILLIISAGETREGQVAEDLVEFKQLPIVFDRQLFIDEAYWELFKSTLFLHLKVLKVSFLRENNGGKKFGER